MSNTTNSNNRSNNEEILRYLEKYRIDKQSQLAVESIIVAYSGVLTIAFKGWTQSLTDLKSALNNNISILDNNNNHSATINLKKENIGTRWPKITLACLFDNQYLTKDQLIQLSDICNNTLLNYKNRNNKNSNHNNNINSNNNNDIICRINSLSLVDYYNRSLIPPFKSILKFNLLSQQKQQQQIESNNSYQNFIDDSCNLDNQIFVGEIIKETTTDNIDSYYQKVTPLELDNRNHFKHYNDVIEETSLVAFLNSDCDCTNELIGLIGLLKETIESSDELKNLYSWMPIHSLHISIRAI